MAAHNYTPEDALNLLLDRVREVNTSLASQIQEAIDSGIDVIEVQDSQRRKQRNYRKTRALTIEEALQVAVKVLEDYFVEVGLFISSANENFKVAAIGVPRRRQYGSFSESEGDSTNFGNGEDREKDIQIELLTETQLFREGEGTLRLTRVDTVSLEEEQSNVRKLQGLLDFKER